MERNGRGIGLLHRVKGLMISAVFGVLAELLVILIFAIAAVKTGSLNAVASACVYAAALAGGFCAGFLAAKKAGKNGLINGAAASLVCALLMWVLALIPAGGGGAALPIAAVICVTGGLVGGLIGVNLSYR